MGVDLFIAQEAWELSKESEDEVLDKAVPNDVFRYFEGLIRNRAKLGYYTLAFSWREIENEVGRLIKTAYTIPNIRWETSKQIWFEKIESALELMGYEITKMKENPAWVEVSWKNAGPVKG